MKNVYFQINDEAVEKDLDFIMKESGLKQGAAIRRAIGQHAYHVARNKFWILTDVNFNVISVSAKNISSFMNKEDCILLNMVGGNKHELLRNESNIDNLNRMTGIDINDLVVCKPDSGGAL